MRGRGRWLAVAIALTPGPARAQATCPEATGAFDDELAHRLAPSLEFGPDERYFPTLPFFPAWQRNNLSRSDSVTWLGPTGRVSWGRLDARYSGELTRAPGEPGALRPIKPRRAAVLYRIRCLTERQSGQLWGFLRNDPQAWTRLGIDRIYHGGLRYAEFVAIEYHLYYLRDRGLEGHPNDLERFVIFVPRRQLASRASAGDPARQAEARAIVALQDSLAVLVGTGHSATTPNNVLVVRGGEAEALAHPKALVELGGHSMAPDIDGDAEFHPGLDINWNLSAPVWGTRDAQAVSGLGYLGEYRAWMTLPRTPGTAARLDPEISPADPAELAKHAAEVRAQDEKQQAARLEAPPPPRPGRMADHLAPYSLVPIRTLERLSGLANRIDSNRATLADSAATVVNDSIRPLLGPGWEMAALPTDTATVLAALAGIRRWSEAMEGAGNGAAHLPWQHAEYRKSPVIVLKRRLFRPTLNGLQTAADWLSLLTLGLTSELGQAVWAVEPGAVVPVFLNSASVPGIIEVAIGMHRRGGSETSPNLSKGSLSIIYDRQYKGTLSYYLGVDWLDDRRLIERDSSAGNVALRAGLSIMPLFPRPDLLGPVSGFLSTRLRVRAGAQVWVRRWKPSLGRLELRTLIYVR
jgi:hypothetical protein